MGRPSALLFHRPGVVSPAFAGPRPVGLLPDWLLGDGRDAFEELTCERMGQHLPGGRNHGAVRIGQTVRRRVGAHTPAVHALLRHLESVGFTRAPSVLGVDGEGREVLTYLDGCTIGNLRPWPTSASSDQALVAAGRWLRDFHVASRSFRPPPKAQWFGDHNELRPGELIGHHDAAPYNAVWRPCPTEWDPANGELVGFIDWDLTGPATPLRDLAFLMLSWVPLTARDVAAADGYPPNLDRPRRLRLILDAYGWTGSIADVLAAVRQRALDHAAGLRAAADSGYGPAAELAAEGVADAFDRAVAELDTSMPDLLAEPPDQDGPP